MIVDEIETISTLNQHDIQFTSDINDVYRHIALEHLRAGGFDDPLDTLNQIYEECLPDDREYYAEIEKFDYHYLNFMQRVIFLTIARDIAGQDAKMFKELYDVSFDSLARSKHGGEKYKIAITSIPPFDPLEKKELYEYYGQYPDCIHKKACEKALQLTVQRLEVESKLLSSGITSRKV